MQKYVEEGGTLTNSSNNDTNKEDKPKWTCEMAITKNFTCCPLTVIDKKFYGTITLKFVNGNVQQILKEESLKI